MEYLSGLLKEKDNLKALPSDFHLNHAARLVNDGKLFQHLRRVVSKFCFLLIEQLLL